MIAQSHQRGKRNRFPPEPAEIEHFMKMPSQNAPRLGEGQLNELRQALNKTQ